MFKDGRTNVHDEERSGRPSVCSEWWSCSMDRTKNFVATDGALQFQNLHVNFHKFHTLLCEIITVTLGYHKFYARWVPEILMGAHKTRRMPLALTF
jgi:hypothetical protein